MESGKVAEEAGPSSGGGSGCSSASASACGKGEKEKEREMIQKIDDEVAGHDDCDDDDGGGVVDDRDDDKDYCFVPGPLIPLKQQIEKDKVFFFPYLLIFSICICLDFGSGLIIKTE